MSKEGLLNCRFLASSACLQERMIQEHQFSFIRDFLQDYQSIPTFTYLHLNEILHDSLTLSKHSDQDFANLLGKDFAKLIKKWFKTHKDYQPFSYKQLLVIKSWN